MDSSLLPDRQGLERIFMASWTQSSSLSPLLLSRICATSTQGGCDYSASLRILAITTSGPFTCHRERGRHENVR
eukprot:9090145-Pyramimonas_sp.AAC.1